jgi:predicted aminopeptidase
MTRLLRAFSFALVSLSLGLAGCNTYVGSVITGELKLLSSVQPIDEALNDPNLDPTLHDKLAFVVQARDYAQNTVGLNVGHSYQTFADLGDRSLAWNLSASRKDAFEPYYWRLPLVGRLPYIGYFNLDEARTERDRLVGEGYDTLIYEVDAYSTVGVLPDPVTSALLRRDLYSLADTVIHELTHNTVFSAGNTTFDESMASFVGRTAGQEFLIATFGEGSVEIVDARKAYADEDRFQAFMQQLEVDLQAVYGTDLSYDDKLAQRQTVITAAQQRFGSDVLPLMNDQTGYQPYTVFPFNNAFLLVNVRYYTDQDVFMAVYESTGRDWGATLHLFQEAAAAPDPILYLRGLVSQ